MESDKKRVNVCGIPIDNFSDSQSALAVLEKRIVAAGNDFPIQVSFINAHTINTAMVNSEFAAVLKACDFNLTDGVGVWLAGIVLRGIRLTNLNGTDFGIRLLEWGTAQGLSFYFLGARGKIAETARDKLRVRIPGVRVVGTHNGYIDAAGTEQVLEEIRNSHADILFVCMGVPSQELWIARHRSMLKGVKLAVGLGAFFDFYSDSMKRAPQWMIKARIEWVYRLCQEPRRLWKRYLLGNFIFVIHVFRFKARLSRLR